VLLKEGGLEMEMNLQGARGRDCAQLQGGEKGGELRRPHFFRHMTGQSRTLYDIPATMKACAVVALALAAMAPATEGAGVALPLARFRGAPAALRLRGGGGPGNGTGAKQQGSLSKMEKRLFQDLAKTGPIFSAEEPGEWQGKQETHVPVATLTDTAVEIVVEHVMDDGTDDGKKLHFIEFIWIIDADTGECLAAKRLLPNHGAEAKASFKGNFKDRCITPYATCNLHGTWRGENVGNQRSGADAGEMDDAPSGDAIASGKEPAGEEGASVQAHGEAMDEGAGGK
jgi:desulfoferrodoxin (superoxide reductase-like protein)